MITEKRVAEEENSVKKLLYLMIIMVCLLSVFSYSPTVEASFREEVIRIAGKNRFDTAVSVSKVGWSAADTVVIARGDQYADALAGVPLAYQLDAPILLTKTHSLPAETEAEIKRLKASSVVILGGEGAVSSSVAATLTAMNLEVERIGGSSRYETAALIAAKVYPRGANTAVIVYGENYPDALSVASFAARAGHPILCLKPMGYLRSHRMH